MRKKLTTKIKPGTYLRAVCTTCAAPATWRLVNSSQRQQYACDAHQPVLVEAAKAKRAERQRIDDYCSEADYQTWMRL